MSPALISLVNTLAVNPPRTRRSLRRWMSCVAKATLMQSCDSGRKADGSRSGSRHRVRNLGDSTPSGQVQVMNSAIAVYWQAAAAQTKT